MRNLEIDLYAIKSLDQGNEIMEYLEKLLIKLANATIAGKRITGLYTLPFPISKRKIN